MAKIIKSLFNTTERRKLSRFEEKDDENSIPPQDFRRKLSISRSGRMRQANKKRQSLCLDVYGQDIQADKQKVAENASGKEKHGKSEAKTERSKRRHSTDVLNPDEEIDNAFEIIDKT